MEIIKKKYTLQKLIIVLLILGNVSGALLGVFLFFETNYEFKYLNTTDITPLVCGIILAGNMTLLTLNIIKYRRLLQNGTLPLWNVILNFVVSTFTIGGGFKLWLDKITLELNYVDSIQMKYNIFLHKNWSINEKKKLIEEFSEMTPLKDYPSYTEKCSNLTKHVAEISMSELYKKLLEIKTSAWKALQVELEEVQRAAQLSTIPPEEKALSNFITDHAGVIISVLIAVVAVVACGVFIYSMRGDKKIMDSSSKVENLEKSINTLTERVKETVSRLDGGQLLPNGSKTLSFEKVKESVTLLEAKSNTLEQTSVTIALIPTVIKANELIRKMCNDITETKAEINDKTQKLGNLSQTLCETLEKVSNLQEASGEELIALRKELEILNEAVKKVQEAQRIEEKKIQERAELVQELNEHGKNYEPKEIIETLHQKYTLYIYQTEQKIKHTFETRIAAIEAILKKLSEGSEFFK